MYYTRESAAFQGKIREFRKLGLDATNCGQPGRSLVQMIENYILPAQS
jgi:hypothetical protein